MKKIGLAFTALTLTGQLTIMALRLRPVIRQVRRYLTIHPDLVAILKEVRKIRTAISN